MVLRAGVAAAVAAEMCAAGAHPCDGRGSKHIGDGWFRHRAHAGPVGRVRCHRCWWPWQHGVPSHLSPEVGACWSRGAGQSPGAVNSAPACFVCGKLFQNCDHDKHDAVYVVHFIHWIE